MTTTTIDQLLAENRYAQERYDLYKARAYSGRPVNASRLRELERAAHGANSRLRRARATAERHAARAGRIAPVRTLAISAKQSPSACRASSPESCGAARPAATASVATVSSRTNPSTGSPDPSSVWTCNARGRGTERA